MRASILFGLLLASHAAFGASWYVSREGDGTTGRSWSSAWTELDMIDWSVVSPGDIVYMDGGEVAATYFTTLAPRASGEFNRPIRIERSVEQGRNGVIHIYGGRDVPLPASGQEDYEWRGERSRAGVLFENVSHVVLDGMGWNKIKIHGHTGWNDHTGQGVSIEFGSSNITLRNLEIFDNGAVMGGPPWRPDQPGVRIHGDGHMLDRLVIHDNGQDAIQGADVTNLTVRRVWLYNARPHPEAANEPFNYRAHQDGIQIYGADRVGPRMNGLLIEDSIIGPGFNQGILLGDGNRRPNCMFDSVTVRNTLFVSHWGASMNAHLMSHDKVPAGLHPRGWVIDGCTFFFNPEEAGVGNLFIQGSQGHRVTNTIFYGNRVRIDDGGAEVANNMQYQTRGGAVVGDERDPVFANTAFDALGPAFAEWDFTPLDPGAVGRGTTIATPFDFYGEVDPEPVVHVGEKAGYAFR